MYYAEKLINGIWHYKTSLNMGWKEMGAVKLANKACAEYCDRCGELKEINGVSGYCDDCRPKNR
jgi:hypothetical protein